MGLFERIKASFTEKSPNKGISFLSSNKSKYLSPIFNSDEKSRCDTLKMYGRIYDKVPLITAIIDVHADNVTQPFYFKGPNSEKLTKLADQINLMRFFYMATKSMLIYGDSFFEVVREGEEIIEFKILDPAQIEVFRKNTGELQGYAQKIDDKKLILWGTTGDKNVDSTYERRVSNTENIIQLQHNIIASEKYGRSIIGPLYLSLNTKLEMESDLKKIVYKYIAPLVWAKIGNDNLPASETAVNDAAATLRDLSSQSEIATSHLVDLKVLDVNAKKMDLETPINHIEGQIITGGQVPPVLLGRGEGADKAVAEVQLRNFGRRIKSIQRELKVEFEDKIIVGLDLGTTEDKLEWEKSEEREWEMDVDVLRGLVTDGILTPQKANDLLPPRFQETLPVFDPMNPLNQNDIGPDGVQKPRDSQFKQNPKVKDNPNDPTQTTKNPDTKGKRVNKTDREMPK